MLDKCPTLEMPKYYWATNGKRNIKIYGEHALLPDGFEKGYILRKDKNKMKKVRKLNDTMEKKYKEKEKFYAKKLADYKDKLENELLIKQKEIIDF